MAHWGRLFLPPVDRKHHLGSIKLLASTLAQGMRSYSDYFSRAGTQPTMRQIGNPLIAVAYFNSQNRQAGTPFAHPSPQGMSEKKNSCGHPNQAPFICVVCGHSTTWFTRRLSIDKERKSSRLRWRMSPRRWSTIVHEDPES